jgi:hypothetical protein
VNQLAQFVFVRPERIRSVEPARSKTAKRAASFFIERKCVQEGSAAPATEEFRFELLRFLQARRADWNPAYAPQRRRANPAIVWEKERKETSAGLFNRGQSGARCRCPRRTTAEDPPP